MPTGREDTRGPCPICHRPAAPRDENGAFPFCSPRCKMVDLGKWLDGQYRVPVIEESEEDEGPGPPVNGSLNGSSDEDTY